MIQSGRGKNSKLSGGSDPYRTSTTTSKTSTDPAALKKMRSLFEQAKAIYAPSGKYMAGIEATVERGEKKAVAGGMQGLAAAGLAGTSMMGGLSKAYQEEVAMPTLARATTQRLAALSGIMSEEAGAEASLAERTSTQTTVGPLQRTYGGGGGGGSATPGFGERSSMVSRQEDRASAKQGATRPTSTKKSQPLSLNMTPYSPSAKTGGVYFGAATYKKPTYSQSFMGAPPGGDVQREPEKKPLSTSAYGMELGMNNYTNFGN
jgi:hypothetical protein